MKGIVVYYSKTGNNKKLGEVLREKLNFTSEGIIDKKRREGIFGFIVSGYDALFKKLTQIEKLKQNVGNFEHIIIGTPVWAGNIPPAIRTFLVNYKDKIKSYSVYSVSGFGEKNIKILNDFENIIGIKPKVFMFIKDDDLKNNKFEGKINKFIENILK